MRFTTGAAGSLLVRIPDAQQSSSGHRWIRRFAGGLFTVAIVVVGITAAIATAGRVLAVSADIRHETRSLVGRSQPLGGLSWFVQPDEAMVTQSYAAGPYPQSGALPANSPRLVLAAASGSLSDDEPLFTGAIGAGASTFSVVRVVPTIRFENPARPDGAAPLPRARPQLAALTPPQLDLRPDGEELVAPRTAIYDINARTVYMPNGEKLEAHSGLGQYMDDPKYVRLRMRGVTPPNTYKLTMREALFHGVEAIRMTPMDQSAMFGRNGILAHSYMLGPSGQSNGCVSFKDYPKFLAAFKRGEVERMVVVFKLEKPPSSFARRTIKSAANTY